MKTQKLKACPFCGSEANQPEDVSVPKYGPWWQVMCSNEQCRAWRPGASPAKAARAWNTRAGDRQPETRAEANGIVPFVSASGSTLTAMVDAFLAWPLPDDVCADQCACERGYPHRSGTNLLDATQARAMLEHVLKKASNDTLCREAGQKDAR